MRRLTYALVRLLSPNIFRMSPSILKAAFPMIEDQGGYIPDRSVHRAFADGNGNIVVLKRVDIFAMQQVGFVLLLDQSIDRKELLNRICAAFDAELVSRPEPTPANDIKPTENA